MHDAGLVLGPGRHRQTMNVDLLIARSALATTGLALAALAWLARVEAAAVMPSVPLMGGSAVRPAPETARVPASDQVAAPAAERFASDPVHGPAGARLAGRVHGDDGKALAGASVTLLAADGSPLAAPRIVGATGEFAWSDLPRGLFRVQAEARQVRADVLVAAPDEEVQIRLPLREGQRPLALSVVVVDESGAPVRDAAVEVMGDFSPHELRRATTDARGECVFEGAPCGRAVVVARVADGRLGCHIRAPGAAAVAKVTLSVAGALSGTIFAPVSLPVGARVVALLSDVSPSQRGHTIAFAAPIVGNRYEFPALPAATYGLSVPGLDGIGMIARELPLPGVTGTAATSAAFVPGTAVVAAGARTGCDLQLEAAGAIEGTVRNTLGEPLPDAVVQWQWQSSPAPAGNRRSSVDDGDGDDTAAQPGTRHPAFGNWTRTDGLGHYRVMGLMPGSHRLTVRLPGRVAIDEYVMLPPGRVEPRDFVLAAAGHVEGIMGHAAVVCLRSETGTAAQVAATGARGLFRFPDVAPGRYELRVVERSGVPRQPGSQAAPARLLTTLEVGPGLTTFIDLRALLPVTVSGHLLGKVMTGTTVAVLGATAQVDAAGRFVVRLATSPRPRDRLRITTNGVSSELPLPAAACGLDTVCVEVLFPHQPTTLRTRAANGASIGATLTLAGAATGTLRIEAGIDANLALPREPVAARIDYDDGSTAECLLEGGGSIDLVAPANGQVHILVTDGGGRPRRDTVVQVLPCPHSGGDPSAAGLAADVGAAIAGVTDAEGRLTLRGLRVGELLVRVAPTDGGGDYPPMRVVLAAGQSVEVHLTPR